MHFHQHQQVVVQKEKKGFLQGESLFRVSVRVSLLACAEEGSVGSVECIDSALSPNCRVDLHTEEASCRSTRDICTCTPLPNPLISH